MHRSFWIGASTASKCCRMPVQGPRVVDVLWSLAGRQVEIQIFRIGGDVGSQRRVRIVTGGEKFSQVGSRIACGRFGQSGRNLDALGSRCELDFVLPLENRRSVDPGRIALRIDKNNLTALQNPHLRVIDQDIATYSSIDCRVFCQQRLVSVCDHVEPSETAITRPQTVRSPDLRICQRRETSQTK